MKKYRCPTDLEYVVAFIFHEKGLAIDYCVRNNLPFHRIEEFEEEE